MEKREKGNLGQKEARLEKEKASELAHMGEKTHGSEKREGEDTRKLEPIIKRIRRGRRDTCGSGYFRFYNRRPPREDNHDLDDARVG